MLKICARFGDDYWLERDRDGGFPHDFHRRSPRPAGSASPCRRIRRPGLGITEAAVMMQAIAESGAGFSGASARAHEHLRPQPGGGVRHGGAEAAHAAAADRRQGEGLLRRHRAQRRPQHDQLKTQAVRSGDGYVVHGQKIWISTAQVAEQVLLLARTTPLEEVKKRTRALPLLHRPRPQPRRGARDRQDGPQGRRLQPAVLRRPAGARWRTASARKARASSTSCTA